MLRDITGLREKLFVLLVCYFKLVNVEGIDKYGALGTFIIKSGDIAERENFFVVFDICITGSHEKLASGDVNHDGIVFGSSDGLNRKGANKRGVYWIMTGEH